MASFAVAGHFSPSLCLLLLLACSSLHAQARESQFFSKPTRYDTPKETTLVKEEQLPAVKKEEPVQYTPDTGSNGYGLYGRGPEKLPPSAATFNENFNSENLPSSEFPNDQFNSVSTYDSKEYNTGNKNYGNTASFPESELNSGSYNKYTTKEPNTKYPTYASGRQQYGMSDTRFMENGRYFFDLNAEESYRNGEYNPAGGNPRAYGSFGVAAAGETFANGGYGYGNSNKGSGYEESFPTGGFQNNRESTQGNQEEYVP
uniref:Protein E6 n=1 Tax=Anthurium amnicola TaxID=1678845 RepID=A0A1D1YL46_9ARAE